MIKEVQCRWSTLNDQTCLRPACIGNDSKLSIGVKIVFLFPCQLVIEPKDSTLLMSKPAVELEPDSRFASRYCFPKNHFNIVFSSHKWIPKFFYFPIAMVPDSSHILSFKWWLYSMFWISCVPILRPSFECRLQWGEYLDLRGMKWLEIGENCMMRSCIICTVGYY
jgi:hypothetical protein